MQIRLVDILECSLVRNDSNDLNLLYVLLRMTHFTCKEVRFVESGFFLFYLDKDKVNTAF
jgi:hypothetical protein